MISYRLMSSGHECDHRIDVVTSIQQFDNKLISSQFWEKPKSQQETKKTLHKLLERKLG